MSANFAKLSILQCTCLLAFGLVFIYLRKHNRKSKLNLLSLPNELLVSIFRIVLQFPNVCSLQLSICRLTAVQLDLFINESLLRLYTHQLKTLYLVLIFEQENYFRARLSGDLRPLSRALQRTIGVINGMRNLHQLALYSHYNLTQLDLPIIGQLDEFYLQCEKSTDLLFDSLVKYGENVRLQQIGLLTTSYLDDLLLTKIFSDAIDTQSLALGITYLKLADFPKLPLDRLNNLLLKLPNLCALSLCWSRAKPFASLVKTLEPFTSANSILKSLHLSILGFPVPDTPQMDLSQWISNGNLPLYSIRSFSLLYDTYSHEDILQFSLHLILPNIERIVFSCNCVSCTTCEYEDSDFFNPHFEYLRKVERCIQLMVAPLQQMKPKPDIHFRYFNDSKKTATLVEF